MFTGSYIYSVFSWGKGKMSFCFWNELRIEWFRNGIRNNKHKSWIDVASLNCICCGTITHTDYFYGVSNWCLMALVSEHQFQIPCLVLICRIEFPLRVYCTQLHFQRGQKFFSGYVTSKTSWNRSFIGSGPCFLTSAKPIREWSVKTVLIFMDLAIHIESWTNADIDEWPWTDKGFLLMRHYNNYVIIT